MGTAFSGSIRTPRAFSGDNRLSHGLSGKIGTLRGSKLAKCRPTTPQVSKCCPRTHRMSKCCPTTTQRPRIARQRHRHRSRAISRGAVAQTFTPVLGTSFSRIGKHLGINAANPRIARGHHALTGTRPNRYSHYWNERISGVGGARGLPPPRSTYWNLFVENENVIAKPSPSTESAKIPTPILSHNRFTR